MQRQLPPKACGDLPALGLLRWLSVHGRSKFVQHPAQQTEGCKQHDTCKPHGTTTYCKALLRCPPQNIQPLSISCKLLTHAEAHRRCRSLSNTSCKQTAFASLPDYLVEKVDGICKSRSVDTLAVQGEFSHASSGLSDESCLWGCNRQCTQSSINLIWRPEQQVQAC